MFNTGWRMRCAGAVVVALSPGPARAERLAVTFPSGWTVSELPAPVVDGQAVPGDRRRAILLGADSKVAAVIELTELPRKESVIDPLPKLLQTAQDTAVADYAAANMDDRCMGPVPVQAGARDGLQIDCTVFRDKVPVLHQVIALWTTAAGYYSLSYSAPPASGETGHAEFAQVLATVGVP